MYGYLGLGSNLGDRGCHLQSGLAELRAAGVHTVALSSVWETEPIDSEPSPWFWNMAIKVRTERSPLELLDLLQAIERRCGRRRIRRNGPRTLDLDLLMLGELQLRHARLALPHPRMWQRRFVLEPLAEIEPELRNPASGRTVTDERALVLDRSVVRRLGPLASPQDLLL